MDRAGYPAPRSISLTSGTRTSGSAATSQVGVPRHYRTKTWTGADNAKLSVTTPHNKWDPYGQFAAEAARNAPLPKGGPRYSRTVNAVGLVAEALRFREENHLGPPGKPLSFSPGWNPGRKRKGARQTAEHTYDARFLEMNSTRAKLDLWTVRSPDTLPCLSSGKYSATLDWMDSTMVTNWSPEYLLDANDQLKLVNRLGEKMRGSDFNMSVFLGEGHQAVALITNAATRIAKAYHSLRRGDLLTAVKQFFLSKEGKDASAKLPNVDNLFKRMNELNARAQKEYGLAPITLKRNAHRRWVQTQKGSIARRYAEKEGLDFGRAYPKEMAGLWLEMAYGWIPLLKDAESGAQFLAHLLNDPMSTTYRASFRREKSTTRVVNWNYCPGYRKSTSTCKKTHKRWLIAKVYEKASVPKLLGVTNLWSVAWELTAFSFVADWFVPIGDWIEARGHAQGLTGVFITSTKRRSEVHSASYPYAGITWYDGGESEGMNYFSDTYVGRAISTSIDVPMPTYKPLNKALSWQHMANAVALIVAGATGQGLPRP